jgi:Raf kinase inhibitor-like YbhB/YbcL family protein
VNWFLDEGMEHSVKQHAKRIAAPELSDRAMIVMGFHHYDAMCVECHGAPGVRHKEIAEGLWPEAPDLAKTASDWKPEELYWIIKNGIKFTGMPAWGPSHRDQDLWALTAFVRTLPAMSASAYAAMRDSASRGAQGDPMRGDMGADGANRAGRESSMTITISSAAFEKGMPIPPEHTCDGEDHSPPLRWQGVPEQAKSLALICEDPDAPKGTWIHWVLWGIPVSERGLSQGMAKDGKLPTGAHQGLNDFKQLGYRGPCPPPGAPHRYYFRLFALDASPRVPERVSAADLRSAMEGHIVAEGALMGTYQRGSK